MNAREIYNPVVAFLLRSPLHGLLSGSIMLITYTGRKSGRRYTTPVSYVRTGGALLVVSPKERVWWRNLRPERGAGAPVTVRVRGKDRRARATAFEGEAAEEGLLTLLGASPAHRRYWRVELGADGLPTDPRAPRRVAEGHALVRVELSDGAGEDGFWYGR